MWFVCHVGPVCWLCVFIVFKGVNSGVCCVCMCMFLYVRWMDFGQRGVPISFAQLVWYEASLQPVALECVYVFSLS